MSFFGFNPAATIMMHIMENAKEVKEMAVINANHSGVVNSDSRR